ncbi:Coenzyme F420 hydrogenase/dehydrogenase, beta subunit C-terminal domain [uncultured Clostridium sp.]|uniref:Coenzyme F420 hydrogenase/dehydrogenase, beta subunit C-terminal domain n=1 Tax=uncultured Clostridium sp. TaxID=59620 RepID=UPI00259197B9|nr:Coenzyme F420 hydrogenase/dehydrogenase, beta subunit C-terminal domain [uncultured Clostridium sp.]
MIEINKKEECHGCHGCFNVCPKKCISMEIDNEGFWYPKVDKSLCIECNLCEKVCPIINIPKRENKETVALACKNKDEAVRTESSSGGVFTLLCEIVIKNGGVVFGAQYDEEFNVRHGYSETIEGCSKFRGSKYVQSIIGETYKQAKSFLDSGKQVLFSGTPCQIAGLEKYLMKKYDNLIMIDIVCHGVPSPLVYRKYLTNMKSLNKGDIKNIQFREKSNGWKDYNFKVEFTEGEFIQKRIHNVYMEGFLTDLYLRPSCYECKFKKPVTSADITLGDYWGVENIHKEFDDDKGVSLILIHTEKGNNIMNGISNSMEVIDTNYEYSIKSNPSIVTPVNYNSKREKFFNNIEKDSIEKNIYRYTRIKITDRLMRKVKNIVKKIING